LENIVDGSIGVCIGLAALAVIVTAYALYRREQRRRARLVVGWVKDYLFKRYGRLPDRLSIDCSDDRLWPVLVSFDNPNAAARHRLQLACPGGSSTLSLLSEREEAR
jgi:hypothetical protein